MVLSISNNTAEYLIIIYLGLFICGALLIYGLFRLYCSMKENFLEKKFKSKFEIPSNNNSQLKKVTKIIERISFNIMGVDFKINAHVDKINSFGRIYLQVAYFAPCTKTGINQEWVSRKWYLSEFMTDDEIIKTAYSACKATVEHEIMEGFKVDNIILFNPHINYEELLAISHKEITRTNN